MRIFLTLLIAIELALLGLLSDVCLAAEPAPVEVPIEKNAAAAIGHPLTSVVVTQCNLIVAVYMTMPDGRLLRFDRTSLLSADALLEAAYTATRSERVEVGCKEDEAAQFEKRDPV